MNSFDDSVRVHINDDKDDISDNNQDESIVCESASESDSGECIVSGSGSDGDSIESSDSEYSQEESESIGSDSGNVPKKLARKGPGSFRQHLKKITPILPEIPEKPEDNEGNRVTQQKNIHPAWENGPRIDVVHFNYVQKDFDRRQQAVQILRDRLAYKSRPGYDLKVQRNWNAVEIGKLILRRYFAWFPLLTFTLSDAAWDGDIVLLYTLLLRRKDINEKDKNGQLVLNICIQQQHEPLIRLLMDRGANLNAQDNITGFSPIITAIIMGNKALVRYLLKQGANVNLEDAEGMAPLNWAAIRGYLEVIAQLILAGAVVDHQDIYGCCALHVACYKGYTDVVDYLLLEGKAQVELKDLNGFTPYRYACIAGNDDITKKLDQFILDKANGSVMKRQKMEDGKKKSKIERPPNLK